MTIGALLSTSNQILSFGNCLTLNQNFACQIEMIHISFVIYNLKKYQSNIRICFSTTVYIKNDLNCTKFPF